MMEDGTDRKRLILNTVRDLVQDLLVYRRQEDEELPVGSIEGAIAVGEVTESEIVEAFSRELNWNLTRSPCSCSSER